jgi:hypothetical protein
MKPAAPDQNYRGDGCGFEQRQDVTTWHHGMNLGHAKDFARF